jgi:hypothetical protein
MLCFDLTRDASGGFELLFVLVWRKYGRHEMVECAEHVQGAASCR